MLNFLRNINTNAIVLLCIGLVFIAGWYNNVGGAPYFFIQASISSLFVYTLFRLHQSTLKSYLIAIIAIECVSTATNLISCYLYAMSLKTAFIYSQYEAIMSDMFIAELAIIGFAVIRDGYSKRHYILRLFANDSRTPNPSNLYAREMPSCTIR